MVIDVSSKNMGVDEFFNQLNLGVQESIHEMEMNLLLDKYNYLQENGVVMEAATEKKSLIGFVIKVFTTVKNAIVAAGKWVIDKIKDLKNKIKRSKADKKTKDAAIKKCDAAAQNADDTVKDSSDQLEEAKETIIEKIEDAKGAVDAEAVKKETEKAAGNLRLNNEENQRNILNDVENTMTNLDPKVLNGWTVSGTNGNVVLTRGAI